MATQHSQGILKLSNELLREVLEYIEADPEKLVHLDKRAYLSQESFKPPSFPPPDQAQDLRNFRLTCRRFSDLGLIHQYARVTTRFSTKGLSRLRKIAEQPRLAKNVKKFSYMVPYFYNVGREFQAELRELRKHVPEVNKRPFLSKIEDQQTIVKNQEDTRVLHRAFSAFTSLLHVQILRIQDHADIAILRHLRHSPDTAHIIEPEWSPACSHSTKTIAAALLSSGSGCSRFSSPMLSPHSARDLARRPPPNLSAVVGKLTSLELHFDDNADLDFKMRKLSDLFRRVLMSTQKLQAIHIGFPSHFPLDIPLEDLFHNIQWNNLIAFGIQAWKLNADEIISLVRRHRSKLRGLRLRDVLLKGESRWRDVLTVLRDELTNLEWVSLRRIGYADRFDEEMADIGIEIEDVPGGDSESGDEEEDMSASVSEAETHSTQLTDTDVEGDSDEDEDENEENGPHANEMSFPPLLEDARRWCECNGHAGPSADDLGDDGISVTNAQRKLWEKWCTKRCYHDEHRRGW